VYLSRTHRTHNTVYLSRTNRTQAPCIYRAYRTQDSVYLSRISHTSSVYLSRTHRTQDPCIYRAHIAHIAHKLCVSITHTSHTSHTSSVYLSRTHRTQDPVYLSRISHISSVYLSRISHISSVYLSRTHRTQDPVYLSHISHTRSRVSIAHIARTSFFIPLYKVLGLQRQDIGMRQDLVIHRRHHIDVLHRILERKTRHTLIDPVKDGVKPRDDHVLEWGRIVNRGIVVLVDSCDLGRRERVSICDALEDSGNLFERDVLLRAVDARKFEDVGHLHDDSHEQFVVLLERADARAQIVDIVLRRHCCCV